MSLNEILPTVNQLSHQDKLRLIHFLLLEVAKEEGCNLETQETLNAENNLLNELNSTQAVVWSPQTSNEGIKALSDLLNNAQQGKTNV